MADQFIRVATDGVGKAVDVSEVNTGAGTVERQRVNLSDPTDPNAHIAVRKASAIDANDDYGAVVQAFMRDVCLALKQTNTLINRAVSTAMQPATGKVRVECDINAGQTLGTVTTVGTLTTCTTVTTVTTCTTVSTVTNVAQMGGQPLQQAYLYEVSSTAWASLVRTRIG